MFLGRLLRLGPEPAALVSLKTGERPGQIPLPPSYILYMLRSEA